MFGCGEMVGKEEKVTWFKGQNSNCIFSHFSSSFLSLIWGIEICIISCGKSPTPYSFPFIFFHQPNSEKLLFFPNFPSPLFHLLPFQPNQINIEWRYTYVVYCRVIVTLHLFLWKFLCEDNFLLFLCSKWKNKKIKK